MKETVGPTGGIQGGNSMSSEQGQTLAQAYQTPVYITKRQLSELLQISETTIDNRLKPKGRWSCDRFPKPRPVGSGNSAIKRWDRKEVIEYMNHSGDVAGTSKS